MYGRGAHGAGVRALTKLCDPLATCRARLVVLSWGLSQVGATAEREAEHIGHFIPNQIIADAARDESASRARSWS